MSIAKDGIWLLSSSIFNTQMASVHRTVHAIKRVTATAEAKSSPLSENNHFLQWIDVAKLGAGLSPSSFPWQAIDLQQLLKQQELQKQAAGNPGLSSPPKLVLCFVRRLHSQEKISWKNNALLSLFFPPSLKRMCRLMQNGLQSKYNAECNAKMFSEKSTHFTHI